MARTLAIDDAPEVLAVISEALRREGHQVDTATSTARVTDLDLRRADLILLDVMMPGEDGFAYIQRIRAHVDVPIVFLTAKTAADDVVRGLGLGADDYLVKPFGIAELRARVAAHLRRERRVPIHTVRVGDAVLDLDAKALTVGDQDTHLTRSEYAIAEYLMARPGQVFSRAQVFDALFGTDGSSAESVVPEHIKNLRAKLRALGAEPIETVWGMGYTWRKA
jgi:DNA-binding response OmpR family regulator